MKKLVLLLFVVIMTTWSCSENKSGESQPSAASVSHKDMNSEVNKTVANLTIEGMTCSSGCGGKIQQDLRALKGVTATDLDYADGRSSNIVSVEFNPGAITELDLAKCVDGIADGKYKVTSIEVLHYHGLQSSGGGGGSDVNNSTFGRIFQLLNLLQSVTSLIQE